MIGKIFGRYTLLPKLGRGGMGEVYLAHDSVLDRNVALKFIADSQQDSAEARSRFLREAKSAAAIDHPYICKIYEVGELDGRAFIAMEFVDGVTLKDKIESGPMPWKEVLPIAIEVTEALMKAHEKGFIHRDLKPANIMMAADGHIRVVDFGLAKRVQVVHDTNATMLASTNAKDGLVGTLAYMSPEQVRVQQIDFRTDLFSLGIVIYEAVTGIHPFIRPTVMETAFAITEQEPRPASTITTSCAQSLDAIIGKLLSKAPDARYQSARDLWTDLHAVTGATPFVPESVPAASAIAVLPLLNMSADQEQEFFSEGVTEDIIGQLSKIEGLQVIARTSVMRYKNSEKDLAQIGRELKVKFVLEGSVRRAGNRVRITSGLVDVETRRQLWSDRFDRDLTDIFQVQSEVSQAIAAALHTTLLGERRSGIIRRPLSIDAYQLYLKARHFLNKHTPDGIEKGIEYFSKVLELYPDESRCYAGISTGYATAGNFDFMRPNEAFPKARVAAARALELNSLSSEAHTSMALVRAFYEWDWKGADESFQRAVELNPSSSEAHLYYSWALCIMRRIDEGLTQAKIAVVLDPLSSFANVNYGWVLMMANRLEESIEQLRRAAEIDPHYPPLKTCMAFTFWAKEQYQEALEQLHGWSWRKAFIAQTHALAGNEEVAHDLLRQMLDPHAQIYERPSEIAMLYMYLGEREQAAAWLDRAFAERDYMIALQLSPTWARGRNDPLVLDYLKRMGLQA